jgi:hypothetical protein
MIAMDVELEDLAVRLANLTGLRWHEISAAAQAHYRRLAEEQIAYKKRMAEIRYKPKLMPPFEF